MSKINIPIIILNIFLFLAGMVLAGFFYVQYQNFKIPYQLSSNGVMLEFNQNYNSDDITPLDNEQIAKIVGEIEVWAKEKPVLLINSDVSNMGMGIYDTLNKYTLPNYTDPLYPALEQGGCIVREGSYFQQNKYLTTLSGKQIEILGKYNNSFALFNEDYEYVFDYFSDKSLAGIFYIDSPETDRAQGLIDILENNNFIVNFSAYRDLNFGVKIVRILSYSLFIVTFISFIFILLNMAFYYLYYFNRLKKRIRIHVLYGATFSKLLKYYTFQFLFNLIISTALGSGLYYFLFNSTYLILPSNYYLPVSLLLFAVLLLLFLICFIAKPSIRPGKLLTK